MSFWDDINPVKLVTKAVNAVVNVVKKAVDAIKTIVETAVKILSKLGEWFAKGVTDFARNIWEGLKWVMDVAADVLGLGKDGWLTEFLTKNIPFAGILAAAIHGIRGNNHHAEYAAAEGLATGVEGLATAAGSLGGPLGGMLGGAIGAATRHGIEQGLRGELDPSVRDKIAPFDLETFLTDITIGAALGGAGGRMKLKKVKVKRQQLQQVSRAGLGPVSRWAGKKAGREAINETALRAAARAGRKGASQASKDIARKLGKDAGTNLTIKNVGTKVVANLPKNVAVGLGREATGKSRSTGAGTKDTSSPKPKDRTKTWAPKVDPVRWVAVVLIFVVGPIATILVLIFIANDGSGPVTVTVALPARVVQEALPPTGLALPPRQTTPGTTSGTQPTGQDPSGTQSPTTQTPTDQQPTQEPSTPTTTTATQAPTPTPTQPAPPEVTDWTLLLLSGAPEGYNNEPIRLRFGLDAQQITSGSVYDPLLEDTMTTYGDVGDGLETQMQSDGADPETGTLYFAGQVAEALNRIDGLYGLYFVVDGEEYYYEGEFTMTRSG